MLSVLMKSKLSLKKEDIDADALLQMREEYIASQKRAAETITTEFDGQKVRIPGFLVPIEFFQCHGCH